MTPAPAPAAAAAGDDEASGVARAVIDELERAHGVAIGHAIERGCLFSEQGKHLMEAFDEYRRRTRRKADAAPFRRLLRERWGVDLTPSWDEG